MQRDPKQLNKDVFDVIVIGGGIYGACVAWDAALRGLSTALIERGDFGQETSANSLKTVHGGLRYLQDFDLNLVRMMINERSTYLRIAPHLVHPLPCLTPTYSRLMKSRAVMNLALKMNDLAGYDRNSSPDPEKELPSSHLFSRDDCLAVLPGLPGKDVTGAALWYDGQIYDTERLTLSFILSAANVGAQVANYVEATGFLNEGNKVIGIKARDNITNEEFEIRGSVVVISAGPWIDHLLEDLKQDSGKPKFRRSLAINIVTRKLVDDYAIGVPSWPEEKSLNSSQQRVSHMLFVSPWRNHSIIGTFHSRYDEDPDNFKLKEQHLRNIIDESNSAYPSADLKVDDITFVHWGFLPEESNPNNAEVKLVRKSRIIDHRREDGLSGLITIVGVKYTTARHAAEKAVDLVFEQLGRISPPCKTHITQLEGGRIDNFQDYLSKAIHRESSILESDTVDHWVRSYGTNYRRITKILPENKSHSKVSPLSDQAIYAQVIHAVREEMAIKLSDVILRRTGLGSIGKPSDSILEKSAQCMAKELGWEVDIIGLEIKEVNAIYQNHGLKNQMIGIPENS